MNEQHNQHSHKINELKIRFNEIKDNYSEIETILVNLDEKIRYLKNIYLEFLKNNNDRLLVFGLDSFKFQNKVIDYEYMQMRKYFSLILNRVYCDYYRLHNIIVKYMKDKFAHEKKIKDIIGHLNKFPKYDFLNVYKEYSFKNTNDIFHENIKLLQVMIDYSLELNVEIRKEQMKETTGLNISNFIHTRQYTNDLLNKQIDLYINYIVFFLQLQKKYINRFLLKAKIMYGQIMKDINFDNNNRMSGKQQQQSSLSPKRNSSKDLHSHFEIDTEGKNQLLINVEEQNMINECLTQSENTILSSSPSDNNVDSIESVESIDSIESVENVENDESIESNSNSDESPPNEKQIFTITQDRIMMK